MSGALEDSAARVPDRGASWRANRPLKAYLAVSAVVFVMMVGSTVNHFWPGLDFWVWLGPVREFAARPLHPHHPLLAVDAADSYMGPYGFVLGMVSRVTGVDAFDVMAAAGFVNLCVVLAGIWQLARCLSHRAWTPLLTLGFTLLAWGWSPWRWSGYLNLNSLGSVLPLGSTFSVGAALFFLASWWRWLTVRSRRQLAAAAAWLVATVLTHQMTGLWAMLVALGFLAAQAPTLAGREWRDFAIAGLAFGVMLLVWPFYPVVRLVAHVDGFDATNSATYSRVVIRSVLAVPGFVILFRRLARRRRDPVALAFVVVAVVFLVGWVTDKGSIGRVLPGAMLMAHLAMADWAASRLEGEVGPGLSIRSIRVGLVGLLLVGLVGTSMGWIRSVPRALVSSALAERLQLDSDVDPNRAFREYLNDDDVVAASVDVAHAIGGYSAKVMAVSVPEPFVSDTSERLGDLDLVLDPDTPADVRAKLIRRYGVDTLVVHAVDSAALMSQLPGSRSLGEVNGHVIIRLVES